MTVHQFLYHIHPWATWPGFLSILVAAFAATAIAVVAPRRQLSWIGPSLRAGVIALLVLAACQVAIALWYLAYPGYLDYVEPGTAAISWLAWRGSPIYTDIANGDLYSQLYGPVLFQITGFFLALLKPSIVTSKVPALIEFAAAQILSYLAVRRSASTRAEALASVGAQCVIQAGFTNQAYAFGVRADPWLFLIGAASTLVATAKPSIKSAAMLGLLAGLAANFKADAALYVVPVALCLLSRPEATGLRGRLAVSGVAVSIVAFVLPFATTDVHAYLAILALSLNRATSRWIEEQNITMIAFLFGPIMLMAMAYRPRLPRHLVIFLASTFACMLLVIFPASKDGAGPHHFLPFLPSMAWATVIVYHTAREKCAGSTSYPRIESVAFVLIVSIVVGYSPIAIQAWDITLACFRRAPYLRTAAIEIANALDEHPGVTIAVGPGEVADVDPAALRVLPVFRGNPLPIDPVTWTEYANDGVGDEIVRKILRECRADIWLFPRDGALQSKSYYTGRRMFTDATIRTFHDNYKLIATGRVFEQWQCTHAPAHP
jgi:hypothetical protein